MVDFDPYSAPATILIAATVAVVAVVLVAVVFRVLQSRDTSDRGFEVKPVGPMPAGLKERDEDHG